MAWRVNANIHDIGDSAGAANVADVWPDHT